MSLKIYVTNLLKYCKSNYQFFIPLISQIFAEIEIDQRNQLATSFEWLMGIVLIDTGFQKLACIFHSRFCNFTTA